MVVVKLCRLNEKKNGCCQNYIFLIGQHESGSECDCVIWSQMAFFFHINIHYQKNQINCLLFSQKNKFQLMKKQQAIHLGF